MDINQINKEINAQTEALTDAVQSQQAGPSKQDLFNDLLKSLCKRLSMDLGAIYNSLEGAKTGEEKEQFEVEKSVRIEEFNSTIVELAEMLKT
jgi:hypothetical protein